MQMAKKAGVSAGENLKMAASFIIGEIISGNGMLAHRRLWRRKAAREKPMAISAAAAEMKLRRRK